MRIPSKKTLGLLFVIGILGSILVILTHPIEEGVPALFAASTMAPLAAFGVALFGLLIIRKDGFLRKDPLHMMNAFFALGLLAFGVADVLILGLILVGGETLFLIIPILHGSGIFLWLLGTHSYLRSVNEVLHFLDSAILSLVIVMASVVPVLVGIAFDVGLNNNGLLVGQLLMAPICVALLSILVSTLILQILYRGGQYNWSFGILFLSILFLLARSVVWCISGLQTVGALDQLLATNGYLLQLAALVVSRKIEIE